MSIDNPQISTVFVITGVVLDATGVVLEPTGAVLEPTGAALEKTNAALDATGFVLEAAGAALESTGAAMEATGVALEATSVLLAAGRPNAEGRRSFGRKPKAFERNRRLSAEDLTFGWAEPSWAKARLVGLSPVWLG